MDLILIRHTAPDVQKGTCYGWSDVDVAPTFITEAECTLQKLREYFPIDKAFTSPLQRAAKLAAFCGFPNAEKEERLKEMNMGEWEMQLYDNIKDPALQHWYEDYMNLPATGGESFPMLYSRVESFLNELKNKAYNKVAIFAHAGPIVAAAIYSGLCTKENAFGIAPVFGGILKITI